MNHCRYYVVITPVVALAAVWHGAGGAGDALLTYDPRFQLIKKRGAYCLIWDVIVGFGVWRPHSHTNSI
jgi:hypothetical protein